MKAGEQGAALLTHMGPKSIPATVPTDLIRHLPHPRNQPSRRLQRSFFTPLALMLVSINALVLCVRRLVLRSATLDHAWA